MSLDTRYRPTRYEDVLGQEATIAILRQFVKTGRGFHQSVLFSGPFGSGKTTLGRIYARALLCASPSDNGDPCDACDSCMSILEQGASDAFVEIDAATNSGKDDVKQITEEIQYRSFSGSRRIYLFDESHRLSPSALDALLKPLEETLAGSDDRKLVCIFCTTEPEKMKTTILSRCAPAFKIEVMGPELIADRLEYICTQEGIEYERSALSLIAEISECHIRDAIKAVEGVSMLGAVDRDNVATYLHLDLHEVYLDILMDLGEDGEALPSILEKAKGVMGRVSPGVFYQRLTEAAMLAYQVSLGITTPPVYWNADRIATLSERGEPLLGLIDRMSRVPAKPTPAMVLCDLSILHRDLSMGTALPIRVVERNKPQAKQAPQDTTNSDSSTPSGSMSDTSASLDAGVYVDPRGINTPIAVDTSSTAKKKAGTFELDHPSFAEILGKRVAYLVSREAGST